MLASLAGGRVNSRCRDRLAFRVSLRHAPLWHHSPASLLLVHSLCMSKGSPLCAGAWDASRDRPPARTDAPAAGGLPAPLEGAWASPGWALSDFSCSVQMSQGWRLAGIA